MRTKVVLTVDTEPSIAGAFMDREANMPLIHEPVSGDIDGKSHALGFLIERLNRYDLEATFFVETVHTSYFPETEMGYYVETLKAAGQDVQLHLHPSWLSFEMSGAEKTASVTDDCSELEEPRLAALITQGCNQIERWTGQRPTGMRTGNFSTAHTVFDAMNKAGLEYSSNICVAVNKPPAAELAVHGGAHLFSGIRELPVTCFTDVGPVGRGKLRPMQITALSANEQIALLQQAHMQHRDVVVIVTHPFEFLKKKDFRYRGMKPNRMVQGRFETLCRFLADNSDRFAVVSLEDAARECSYQDQRPPLKGNALRATMRATENFINDRLI